MIARRYLLKSAAAIGAAAGVGRAFAMLPSGPEAARSAAADILAGKIYFKGEGRYEALRHAATWNARKPNRFPNAIVLAASEADVVAAVKLAKERGWQVSARSGGNSFSASHTRDNSVQINLSQMKQIQVDAKAGIAKVSPSVSGNALNKKLREEYDLFTPSAHGVNIGMGGFVMAGGHGWNSRAMGLGCANLQALDVVTADGDLIHASETENSDYLWAARGSGPGYFGVATRYYLKVYKRPHVMKQTGYVYALDDLEPLLRWLRITMPSFPRNLEVVLIAQAAKGTPTLMIAGTCMGDSDREVRAALAILDTCPIVGKAKSKWANVEVVLPLDVEAADESMPTGARYAVDNIWTNASAAELISHMRKLLDFPTPQSHVFIQVWGPVQTLPDMAYSVQGDIYIACNAVYYDPADDARCATWAVEATKRLDRISVGAQMNDENTEHHKARYLSPEAAQRLETMRNKYDPERRFPGFL